MKNIKFSDFEIYLLMESITHYKELLAEQEFPQNSILTKEYVEIIISEIEKKFSETTVKQRVNQSYAH